MGSVDTKSRGAVLVVDDDEDLRAMIRDALEFQRYFVLEAEDGKDALDILRLAGTPLVRLVVMDLVMPCMTGWELVEALRSDPSLSKIPVLVMSGLPVHGDASGIGATMQWLRKPFGEDELFLAVSQAVGNAPGKDDDAPKSPRGPAGRRTTPSHPER